VANIINVKNNDGRITLHMAIIGNIHTASSIKLNICDVDGMTPLNYLKQHPTSASSDILIKELISAGGMFGCAVLYIGQGSFHHSMTNILQYVVHQADSTVDKLGNVSDYLAQAKQVEINRVFLPTNVQTDIDQAETDIDNSTSTIVDKTKENSANIHDLLDSARLALIIIVAVMLVLTLLGFLFSIFGIQLLVYILVIAGWVLVTGTLILCGLFLVLHYVTADSCVAVNEWIQHPIAHTAMDAILPCVDNSTAQETLSRSKEVTSELVNLVNQDITNVSNSNLAPNLTLTLRETYNLEGKVDFPAVGNDSNTVMDEV